MVCPAAGQGRGVNMLGIVVALVAAQTVLVTATIVMHRRRPFTGGPYIALRVGWVFAALSLLCMTAAALIAVPQTRGVFAVAALAGVGAAAVVRYRSAGPRIGPMQADTEAAAAPRRVAAPDLSTYTVRGAQPAPAHANVRSARVRKIQAMGSAYAAD